MDPTAATSAATDLAANCSVPPFVVGKDAALRAVVGVTCVFSILGSLLIILSYSLFKDLRTTARLILLHLSLTDFGVAFSNLFGDWFRFYRFATCSADQLPDTPLLAPPSMNRLCIAQAFFAHFSTISSVLWTMMLAAYMYSVITKIKEGPNSNRLFLVCSYIFCYGMPLAVNIWMVVTGKLGYAPYDTSGWCGTIITDPHLEDKHHRRDYMAAILGYDLWIVLTIVFIVAIYVSLHFYVRKEKKTSSSFQDLIANIDYKFIAIPMAFVLLRIWSLLDTVLFLYLRHIFHSHHQLRTVLDFFTGIGDSGQGAVNGIIFVIFTRSVRHRILAIFCWCSRRRRRKKDDDAKREFLRGAGDNEISDDSDSGQYEGSSSPMLIDRSPSKQQQQQQHMGSMATTTSINISNQSLSSYDTA